MYSALECPSFDVYLARRNDDGEDGEEGKGGKVDKKVIGSGVESIDAHAKPSREEIKYKWNIYCVCV